MGFFVTHEIQFNYKFNPQRRTKNLDRLWAFVFTVKIVWDIGHQAPPVQLQNLFFDCQFFVCPYPLLSVGTTIPKLRNDPPALVGNKQTFPKLHLSLVCDQYYWSCSNFNWDWSIRPKLRKTKTENFFETPTHINWLQKNNNNWKHCYQIIIHLKDILLLIYWFYYVIQN